MVLTHKPNMWLIWKKNAAQAATAIANRDRIVNYFLPAFSGGVYFHWNYWCEAPLPRQTHICKAIERHYHLELIKEFKDHAFRFALYRVHIK